MTAANNDSKFYFSVNREDKTITVKRELPAGVSLVWDAFTKKEILEQWWAPKPWKAKIKQMDFREGGRCLYAMVSPQGEEHWCLANYETIHPKKSFTLNDAFCDSDGNINIAMPQSRWEVTFTGDSDSTLVQCKLSYDSLVQLDEIIKMGFKEGFTMTLDELKRILPSLRK